MDYGTSKHKSHYTQTTGLHFTIANLEPPQMCHLSTRLSYPFSAARLHKLKVICQMKQRHTCTVAPDRRALTRRLASTATMRSSCPTPHCANHRRPVTKRTSSSHSSRVGAAALRTTYIRLMLLFQNRDGHSNGYARTYEWEDSLHWVPKRIERSTVSIDYAITQRTRV